MRAMDVCLKFSLTVFPHHSLLPREFSGKMMDPMVASPTGSLLRWTLRIAVVLLSASGVYFLVAAYQVNQKLRRDMADHPLDVAVDLSKPGTYVWPVRRTSASCHGQSLGLIIKRAPKNEPLSLPNPQGKWKILTDTGMMVVEGNLENSAEAVEQADGITVIFRSFNLRSPDNQLFLEVTEATPAIAGLSQRLVCSNIFCEMEKLTVVMCGILAAGCLLVALVLARISSWLQRRETIRAARTMEQQSSQGISQDH